MSPCRSPHVRIAAGTTVAATPRSAQIASVAPIATARSLLHDGGLERTLARNALLLRIAAIGVHGALLELLHTLDARRLVLAHEATTVVRLAAESVAALVTRLAAVAVRLARVDDP